VRPNCHICRWPIADDEMMDPLLGKRHDDDRRELVLGNGMIVRACLRCWLLWPAAHKLFPAYGYGRSGEKPTRAELVALLREAA